MKTKKLKLYWLSISGVKYHVGNLIKVSDTQYLYQYADNLDSALMDGYRLLATFPDIKNTYSYHKVFSVFSRRLTSKNRPDYLDILKKQGVTEDSDDFEKLAVTGGKLATDNYEFSAS